ncbi:MAG: hypothetical protein DRR04_11060 [Gammaproteobacteria bacterium]|nr:MAG: hypothetical protein DRR04_11060 [Gammaproteobacteria bacterium]
MKLKTIAAVILFVIGLAGCQTLVATDDLPAWITNPDGASRAALQTAVNEALNTDVALADDALTDSSILTIERNIPGSLEGQPAQGRNMDMPIQFRLVISGGDCVLIDQRDESRRVLENTSCKAR